MKPIVSFQFQHVGDGVAKAMETFRRCVYAENYKISTHASKRMVSRGIALPEILNCIQHGQLSKGRYQEGYIGGLFVHNGLVIAMYSPYGVANSTPVIVTMYRPGEDDDYYEIGELTVPVGKSVSSMTDDELEAELLDRKHRKAEALRLAQETTLRGLIVKEEALLTKLTEVQLGIQRAGGTPKTYRGIA